MDQIGAKIGSNKGLTIIGPQNIFVDFKRIAPLGLNQN